MSGLRSLRVRLTLTFVAVGAVLVMTGYIGTAWLLRRAVWHPLDAALQEEAASVELVRSADDAEGEDEGEREETDDDDAFDGAAEVASAVARLGRERDLGPDKFLIVSAADGRVIAASGRPPSAVDVSDQGALRDGARFVVDGRSQYRVLTHRLTEGGWVLIGVRVDRQVRAMRRALLGLLAGAVAMLGGIGILAWSMTSRATREIADVTAELGRIGADSLSRRLRPRDTTEVAALAAALNDLLARLELAVRRLQRFTADAAHELRTPLAALRARLDVALARPRSADAYRDGLLDAVEQTERLTVLSEDLLTLSAIESADPPVPTAVDFGALAIEVAEFLEAVAQEQQRHFNVTVGEQVLVLGEAVLLKRLLLNLLGNAFTHTEHGVAVRLDVQRDRREVVLTVRDHGGGIAPADQHVLFERFAVRHSRRGGAGLGLAICREIVARHHGTIALDSRVGTGTTVTVRLPSASA